MSLNQLPKIEGFQPIPNSIMVPFMETQSAALAYAFGLNYEYGKRKIKSMDNETYNSLTSEQIAEMSSTHTSVLLEQFIKKIPMALTSQDAVFKGYFEIETRKIETNVKLFQWVLVNLPRLLAENHLTQDEWNRQYAIATSGQTATFQPPEGQPAYNPIPEEPKITSRRAPTPAIIPTTTKVTPPISMQSFQIEFSRLLSLAYRDRDTRNKYGKIQGTNNPIYRQKDLFYQTRRKNLFQFLSKQTKSSVKKISINAQHLINQYTPLLL